MNTEENTSIWRDGNQQEDKDINSVELHNL